MIIDTSAGLSSADLNGLEKLNRFLGGAEGVSDQFAAALKGQVELLQQAWANRSGGDQNDTALLQKIAALRGTNFPPDGKKIDIDLEATLKALADVLNYVDRSTQLSEDQDMSDAELAKLVAAIGLDVFPSQASVNLQQLVTKQRSAVPIDDVNAEVVARSNMGNQDNTLVNATSASEQDRYEAMLDLNDKDFTMVKDDLTEKGSRHLPGELVTGKNADVGQRQPYTQMVSDLAVLDRVVSTDGKTELSPMMRHFAHPQWGQEFSERLVWMHKQAVPAAELNLHPRHLGPVSIRIDVNQDQTSIAFTTHHAVVKEAIEAAIPKLREMLGAQQLNLVDVNVSQQQSEQRQANGFLQPGGGRSGGQGGMEGDLQLDRTVSLADEIAEGRAVAAQGIVNLFA